VKLPVLVALFVVGVLLAAVGVALMYPPAALVLIGVVCSSVALRVKVGDE